VIGFLLGILLGPFVALALIQVYVANTGKRVEISVEPLSKEHLCPDQQEREE
jgi:hypothetical protein